MLKSQEKHNLQSWSEILFPSDVCIIGCYNFIWGPFGPKCFRFSWKKVWIFSSGKQQFPWSLNLWLKTTFPSKSDFMGSFLISCCTASCSIGMLSFHWHPVRIQIDYFTHGVNSLSKILIMPSILHSFHLHYGNYEPKYTFPEIRPNLPSQLQKYIKHWEEHYKSCLFLTLNRQYFW